MQQLNIFGEVEQIATHPQFEDKLINENYYGSKLNQFVAEKCKREMTVMNIDLIINDYKNNSIRIIESKHSNEKLGTGQRILLEKLSKIGIKTYCVYGNYPYEKATIFSFQNKQNKEVNNEQLIKFLNNE